MLDIVKFVPLDPRAVLPTRGHTYDAGLDLTAIDNPTLTPGGDYAYPTGLGVIIPQGFVGLIWPRSGNAFKQGTMVLAGVIDSGYQGEIKVILNNRLYLYLPGDKVGQLLIQPVEVVEAVWGSFEEETERGEKGFGSTDGEVSDGN